MEKMFKRLLSFAIALFMVLGMVPGSVFEAYAADDESIGDVTDTEAELSAAVLAGGNVTLGGDIEIATMIEVSAGVTTVLDLAGHAITSGYQTDSTTKHIYPFDVYGNLTIKDSVGGGSISGRGIYVQDGGTLTVESGTIYGIDDNGGSALYQYGGDIVINGGTIEQTAAGTYNYAIYAGGGTITINGGTITGKHGALSVSGAAATVNGGELICTGNEGWTDNVIYVSAGSLTFNDGTVLHKGNEVGGDSGAAVVAANDTVTIDIKGGSITGYNGSVSGNANTTISGGSFSTTLGYDGWDNLEQYVTPGSTVTIEGETYTAEGAATFVAYIGETGYATLADALAAAKTMTGDVTVEIYDKVTLAENLSGSFDSIKFVGMDTDAEIYLDVQGYITATGKKVAFEDLILSKAEGGYITNAGFMNVAFGVYDVAEVTYTGCTFSNGAYASSGAVTYTDCTFYRSYDKYGLWAYGNVDVVVDGCTFADYRGIKMYAEGAAKTVNLTVKNTDFSAVTDKPAIVLTYGESVTLENNTYSDTGVFELDLDGAPNGTPVTTDDVANLTAKNDNGICGVLVDGKIYATVAQAAEVAVAGSTVVLLHDSAETVELAEGVILDKNGYTAAGVTVEEPEAPASAGTVNGCFIMNPDGDSYITTAINNLYAEESVVLKLTDAEGTLLATSSLVDNDRVLLGKELAEISGTILIAAEDDWWNTQWEEGKLSAEYVPATITLFVDGQEMNSTPALIRNHVELPLNWAEVNGVQPAAATGTLNKCYISEDDTRARVYGEITGMANAKESIVVKLYSGETLLATTTLANADYLSNPNLGVNIVISGKTSSSWNTVWEEGHPVADMCPDKAVLYIDGNEMNTAEVTLGTIDDLGKPYVWEEITGVAPVAVTVAQTMDVEGNVVATYTDFEEALAAACADESVVRLEIVADYETDTVAYTEDYHYITKALTIGVPEGETHTVTIKPTGDSIAVCVQNGGSLTIEEGLIINHLDVTANGFGTTGENMNIDGTLYALSLKQWTSNGTITVSETGKVILGNGDGQLDLAYGNGTVTINGTGDKTTDQFKAGYSGTRGNGNTLNLNDTSFEAGAWFNVNGSNGTVNVNNSVLKVSGGDSAGTMKLNSTGNAVNLTNGSVLKVAALTLGAGNTLTLDATSTVEVSTLAGAGALVIDATGLKAGDTYTAISGDLSGFTGIIEVTGASMEAEIVDGAIVLKAVAPELPTATVTELDAESLGLTFAMNFLADPATDAQVEYYGAWPADYTLTSNKDIVFNANGNADGWLSGQYDAFGDAWVNVPFEDVTLKAGEPIRVMEYAMELMGYETALTYADIYGFVKDFNCGLYLDEEFLAANPDLEITLDLRMYNPEDPTESYAIGETYEFEAPAPKLPTATVTMLDAESLGLTFAMNFLADPATDAQLDYYGTWPADYILSSNKDIVFNADGTGDGWLSGQYDAFGEEWVNVPFENVTLKAGEPIRVMEYAMELMGYETALTYNDIYSLVKDFNCGVFLDEEFLAANPDLEVTLDLRMYNPENPEESYAIGETYEFEAPAPKLPTATVTEIENEDLTFALNFKADEATQAQLDYYGAWYADYVLTVNKDVTFNANGNADGWLSGQYDAYSENWVNVPFEDVTLKAGESIKIMEYAATLMGKPGLKQTCNDIYKFVKDFDCGVFFDEEFLAANPDLEVTLELRIYNNEDETESYTIGETYAFEAPLPELPTATVTEIENENLTFAMNFKADEATYAQLYHYGSWYADYVLTINKDVTFNADGGADGYLSGQYDKWSENWVNVPYGKGNVSLKAGEPLRIMAFAADLMGKPGLKYTYKEVYEVVKDFDCGVFFTPEFLAANPDLEVTLELRMYNPADETESYVIGDPYVFTLTEFVAENVQTGERFATVQAALNATAENETVRLLKNVTGENAEAVVLILNNRTLDLNGFTLEAINVIAVTGGARITDSTNGTGLLKVAKTNLTLPGNDQLPVWIEAEGGFRFAEVQFKFQGTYQDDGSFKFQYYLTGALDGNLKEQLKHVETNGLKIVLRIAYTSSDNSDAKLDLVIPADKVVEYAGKNTGLFTTYIRGLQNLGTATITPCVTYGDIALGNAENGTFYYTTPTN